MNDILNGYQNIRSEFLDYIEYLHANGLELDENGNEVSKDAKQLLLTQNSKDDDDDE